MWGPGKEVWWRKGGGSRSNCPRESWNHNPLPGTAGPFGLGKSEGQEVRETEGQVLPFPQLIPGQMPTKKSISSRPGFQPPGLPPLCHPRPRPRPRVRTGAAEGTQKGLGPFTYHWPYRPISREGIGPRWHSSV